jgi:osmoprotectant transport system ATP-binding protein
MNDPVIRENPVRENPVRENPVIAFEGVGVAYDGAPAVEDVSMEIPRGAFVAIVGASGSGKTTLLKTINRLRRATAGRVLFEGRDVATLDGAALRRRMGYVMQEGGVFPHLDVAENIAVTPRLLGWPKARISARVRVLLDLLELPQAFSTRRPATLSGGQRQRVAIARAIAAEPPVVLMDEPFGALDPLTRATFGASYRAIHDRLGLTTVMVTHDLPDAALSADIVAAMASGKLLSCGPPAQALAGPASAMFETPLRQAQRFVALADGAAAGA